jgi:hypothetical protein
MMNEIVIASFFGCIKIDENNNINAYIYGQDKNRKSFTSFFYNDSEITLGNNKYCQSVVNYKNLIKKQNYIPMTINDIKKIPNLKFEEKVIVKYPSYFMYLLCCCWL